jgi:predicted short-subunit dehydrogenase-like oxidoreductase (DUF2520 family)
MIKKITFIGSGNVAHNLGKVLLKNGIEIIQVYSRNIENAKKLAVQLAAAFTDDLRKLNTESDLYIIASSDNAIEKIANQLDLEGKLVVHTSGSVSIKVLTNATQNCGSFYPLQTFTKSHQADFTLIPICIEASSLESFQILKELANNLSTKVVNMTSEQRQKLHLAAVFVSNFSNYMQVIGYELCEEQQVDFNLLKPLIKEVFEKNQQHNAIDNQTGPALRGDTFTMNKHLDLLENNKELSELYQLISNMIGKSK